MSDRRHEILEKLPRPDAETIENRKRYFKLTAMVSVIVAVVLLVTSIIIIGGAILLHKLKILKKLPDLSLRSTRWAGALVALFSILIGTGLSAGAMSFPLRLLEEYIDMVDRLTHGNFLQLYRKVLKMGGQIHFKTDNAPLFEFSVEEFAACGLEVKNLTRNLHENGIVGIMTGYEEKFHALGTPINRCEVVCKPFVLPKEEKKEETEE